MDITFVANDTRGGVDPYLALSAEAVGRGHTVRTVAPPQYETACVAVGARFGPLRGAEQAQAVASEGSISLREMGRRVVGLSRLWAADTAEVAQGTDVLVSGIGGMSIARPVAQAVGAQLLRTHLQPLEAPSSRYPGPLAPRLEVFGAAGTRLSHTATAAGTTVLSRQPERAARAALRLEGRPLAALPMIAYGFSEAVVGVASDSGTERIATGYWSPEASEDVDPRLEAFVDRPGPIVSVGFGSMVTSDPRALRGLVTSAARRADTRVVLLTGWGALDEADEEDDGDVFVTASAPHGWLFPRMSAAVHHGGAGTTGAALAAGSPTVIVPFGADQPFWARRAHRLGVSPPPLRRTGLTETRLAQALSTALTDTRMRQRARELSDVRQRDRGAVAAVDMIETALGGRS